MNPFPRWKEQSGDLKYDGVINQSLSFSSQSPFFVIWFSTSAHCSHITGKRRRGTAWDKTSWPWIQPRVGVSWSRSRPKRFVTSMCLCSLNSQISLIRRQSGKSWVSLQLIAVCAVEQNHQQVSCLPKYAGRACTKPQAPVTMRPLWSSGVPAGVPSCTVSL